MTKIYCDIAEIKTIQKFNKKKIVKGFTTNPSLMRKAGAINYEAYSKKILKISNQKPVSLEVFADNHKQMKKQGIQINKWAKNVYVKVPIVNSKGEFYINNVPEGKYQLIMIDDLDKNNAFSYGTVSPYKNSEWFYAHPDTFEVRANWDIDVGQISMEEK